MAKRSSKGDAALIGLVVILAIPVWLISKLTDSIGVAGVIVALISVVCGIIAVVAYKRKRRLDYLRAKYSDETTVQRIMSRMFWQGQTAAELMDSLGRPLDIDHKVMATRNRQVWKYHQRGRNRYGLRITLDDGIVNRWDSK